MKYRLTYAQPRPSSGNPTTVVYERKEHIIEASTAAEAQGACDRFLRQGAVTCGSATYVRAKVTFMPFLAPSTPALQPKPEFLPSDEMD